MEQSLFVGIDVAKDGLDVHVRPTGEAFRIVRDNAGLAGLAERLARLRPALVALEATGAMKSLSRPLPECLRESDSA
jgi:transposase